MLNNSLNVTLQKDSKFAGYDGTNFYVSQENIERYPRFFGSTPTGRIITLAGNTNNRVSVNGTVNQLGLNTGNGDDRIVFKGPISNSRINGANGNDTFVLKDGFSAPPFNSSTAPVHPYSNRDNPGYNGVLFNGGEGEDSLQFNFSIDDLESGKFTIERKSEEANKFVVKNKNGKKIFAFKNFETYTDKYGESIDLSSYEDREPKSESKPKEYKPKRKQAEKTKGFEQVLS